MSILKGSGATAAYQVLVSTEVAGDPSSTATVSLATPVTSTFDFVLDEDVFAFDAITGVPYTITADLEGTSTRRIDVRVIDETGNDITPRTASTTDSKTIDFTSLTTGTVYIKVREASGNSNYQKETYTLTVLPEGVVPTDGDETTGDNGGGSNVSGSSSGDTLTSGSGDEVIDGGGGLDVVKYDVKLGDASVSTNVDGTTTINASSAGEGNDTLIDVERVQFSDGMLALDVDAGENAGSAYRVYQAAFARTPDNDGLKFWIGQVDVGVSLYDVARGFLASVEFQTIYGTNPSSSDFVARLYANVLGRDGEAAGIAFWTGELTSGARDMATVLTQFSESAENIAGVSSSINNGIWYV